MISLQALRFALERPLTVTVMWKVPIVYTFKHTNILCLLQGNLYSLLTFIQMAPDLPQEDRVCLYS